MCRHRGSYTCHAFEDQTNLEYRGTWMLTISQGVLVRSKDAMSFRNHLREMGRA